MKGGGLDLDLDLVPRQRTGDKGIGATRRESREVFSSPLQLFGGWVWVWAWNLKAEEPGPASRQRSLMMMIFIHKVGVGGVPSPPNPEPRLNNSHAQPIGLPSLFYEEVVGEFRFSMDQGKSGQGHWGNEPSPLTLSSRRGQPRARTLPPPPGEGVWVGEGRSRGREVRTDPQPPAPPSPHGLSHSLAADWRTPLLY